MKQTAKYFLLSAIILASMTQVYCFAFADETPDKAVKTIWTSPELDGEVLELFFSPDTNILYPGKVLIYNSERHSYSLVCFTNSGGIDKTITLATRSDKPWDIPWTVTWTPDGKKFCVASQYIGPLHREDARYRFTVYDEAGRKLISKDNAGIINAISPDGKYILTINGGKGMVELYDNQGRLIKAIDKTVGYGEGIGPTGKVQFVDDKIFVLIEDMKSLYTFYAINRKGNLLFKLDNINKNIDGYYVEADFIASNKGDFVIIHSGDPEGYIKKYDMSGKMLWRADVGVIMFGLAMSNNNKYLFVYDDGLAYGINTITGEFKKVKDRRIGTSSRKVLVFDNGTAMFTQNKNNLAFITQNGEFILEDAPGIPFSRYIDLKRKVFVEIDFSERHKMVVKKAGAEYMDKVKARGGFTNEK